MAPASGPSRVILLVDDEADILESTKDVVEAFLQGTTVVTKPSGAAGLACLGAQEVDLIVSDYKMPGMDGIQFLRECRRLRPAVPRVMMTAYPSDELADRAREEAFVQSFIPKAGDPDVLVAALARILGAMSGRAAPSA